MPWLISLVTVFEIPLGFCSLVSYKMNKLAFFKGFGFLPLPLQLSAQFRQTLVEVVCQPICPVILESVCVI